MGSRPRRTHSRLGGAAVVTGSGEVARIIMLASWHQKLTRADSAGAQPLRKPARARAARAAAWACTESAGRFGQLGYGRAHQAMAAYHNGIPGAGRADQPRAGVYQHDPISNHPFQVRRCGHERRE